MVSIPEHIEAMYEPLEELSTCIYFQKNINEFSSDDIKVKKKFPYIFNSKMFIEMNSFTGFLQYFLVFSIAILNAIVYDAVICARG